MVPDNSAPFPSLADIERQHGIPADTYCGLTAEEMSRAVVAYHSGPRKPGEPVGYMPVGDVATRLSWLREEFGPDVDVERLRIQEQCFGARVSRALQVDWMLPDGEFDQAVSEGLRLRFPELSEDARRVIAANYSYSHAK